MADSMEVDQAKPQRFQIKKVRWPFATLPLPLSLTFTLHSSAASQWNAVCLWSWDIVVDNVSWKLLLDGKKHLADQSR